MSLGSSRRGLPGEDKIPALGRMRHSASMRLILDHDGVIKWKLLPRYWTFVWEIHRWPVNSPHNGQWRGALMFSLICAWINGWVNNCEAGDLRRHRAHCDVRHCNVSWLNNIFHKSAHAFVPNTINHVLIHLWRSVGYPVSWPGSELNMANFVWSTWNDYLTWQMKVRVTKLELNIIIIKSVKNSLFTMP